MGKSAISEWMPFYGDRFLKDFAVVGMSDTARLLYVVLLWRQWESGGIPQDPEVVARISTLSVKSFNRSWREVEPMFPVNPDGLRRNQTLAGHRDAALGKIENYRENADRMNAARQRVPSRAPLQDSSRAPLRSPSLDGDGERHIPPPPPRLSRLLCLWDAHRSPLQKPAPPVSPSLVKAFTAADVPGRDWDAICLYLCTTADANGTGTPGRGYKVGFAASFGWMLTPKGIEAAEQQTFGRVDIDPIKFQAAKAMAELERRQRERNGNQLESGDTP